jgi:hypothetical protein
MPQEANMLADALTDWYLYEREQRLTSAPARFRREWEASQKVEQLETELKVERLRLGDDPATMSDVWRKLPV